MSKWDEWFYYDETSVSFLRWKVSRWSGNGNEVEHIVAGQVAGCQDSKGQYQVNVDGKSTMVHRVIWELLCSEIPEGFIIDHKNGDGTYNQVENLRCIPSYLNARNMKRYATNSSGVCGVSLLTNKTAKGTNSYWSAKWADRDGRQVNKRFSVARYGDEEAFRLACEYRTKMIKELNAQGAGYTDDHGKR